MTITPKERSPERADEHNPVTNRLSKRNDKIETFTRSVSRMVGLGRLADTAYYADEVLDGIENPKHHPFR